MHCKTEKMFISQTMTPLRLSKLYHKGPGTDHLQFCDLTTTGKEPTLLFEKSRERCGLLFTHHSYHGLWVGFSNVLNGQMAAASGALVC